MGLGEEHMNIFERMIAIVKSENWKTITKSLLLIIILILIMCSGIWASLGAIIERTIEKKEIEKKEYHTAALQIRKDIRPQIDSILNRTLHVLGADRVFVIEMHNGTSNTAGLPFLYGEMTYEVVSDSVKSVDEDYVNLNLSRFNFPFHFEKKHIWIGSINELSTIDDKLAKRLSSNDVSYLALSHMYGIENELGYFGVTYCNNRQPKNKELIATEILKDTQLLSTLLDINNINENNDNENDIDKE